jgi:hypothetical protein
MYDNKFGKIFESNFQRFQGGGILAGDVVKFVDNILDGDWIASQTAGVKDKIQELLDSDLNIRVSSVHAKRPAVSGSVQQDQQADEFYCDVVQELAPGLFNNVITVPIEALEQIDTGNNLAPIPDSQRREDSSHIKPEEPNLTEGEDETCPVRGTYSKRDDRSLEDRDKAGIGAPGEDNMTTAVYMH